MTHEYKIVVAGVSAGGFNALSIVIPGLPADFPLPIAVVQHRQRSSDDFLARHLNEKSSLTVKEADDKEPFRPGFVYLAPADYHLLIERDGTFGLSVDERVNHCRPSIDVLFESAADVFEEAAIGNSQRGAAGVSGGQCRGEGAEVRAKDLGVAQCFIEVKPRDINAAAPLAELGIAPDDRIVGVEYTDAVGHADENLFVLHQPSDLQRLVQVR